MLSVISYPVFALSVLFALVLSSSLFPLGWFDAPSYESVHGLVVHPITRLYLFVLIFLPLFHWAHRFRYTVYDLFQIQQSLQKPIAVVCYGTALLGTVVAAYTLLTIA